MIRLAFNLQIPHCAWVQNPNSKIQPRGTRWKSLRKREGQAEEGWLPVYNGRRSEAHRRGSKGLLWSTVWLLFAHDLAMLGHSLKEGPQWRAVVRCAAEPTIWTHKLLESADLCYSQAIVIPLPHRFQSSKKEEGAAEEQGGRGKGGGRM